jgi:hypothetical protein
LILGVLRGRKTGERDASLGGAQKNKGKSRGSHPARIVVRPAEVGGVRGRLRGPYVDADWFGLTAGAVCSRDPAQRRWDSERALAPRFTFPADAQTKHQLHLGPPAFAKAELSAVASFEFIAFDPRLHRVWVWCTGRLPGGDGMECTGGGLGGG